MIRDKLKLQVIVSEQKDYSALCAKYSAVSLNIGLVHNLGTQWSMTRGY